MDDTAQENKFDKETTQPETEKKGVPPEAVEGLLDKVLGTNLDVSFPDQLPQSPIPQKERVVFVPILVRQKTRPVLRSPRVVVRKQRTPSTLPTKKYPARPPAPRKNYKQPSFKLNAPLSRKKLNLSRGLI